MKLFTTILLSTLFALSFGKDTLHTPDTTYIGNSRGADDERRHAEIIREAERTATATENLPLPTWVAAIAGSLAFIASSITLLVVYTSGRKQLRAYVHVEHPVAHFDAIQRIWSYEIKYTNYGKTPARKVRFNIGTHFSKSAMEAGFPVLTDNPRAPIGPGQTVPWLHFIKPERLIDEGFPGNTDFEYLYGSCHYFDGYKPQITDFRFYRKKGEPYFNVDDAGNESS
jgi:hypothetical protein